MAGFSFSPSTAALPRTVSLSPLALVDGRTLVPTPALQVESGVDSLAKGSIAGLESLLSGIRIGAGSLVDTVKGVQDYNLKREQQKIDAARGALELARETAGEEKPLTPLEQAKLNRELIEAEKAQEEVNVLRQKNAGSSMEPFGSLTTDVDPDLPLFDTAYPSKQGISTTPRSIDSSGAFQGRTPLADLLVPPVEEFVGAYNETPLMAVRDINLGERMSSMQTRAQREDIQAQKEQTQAPSRFVRMNVENGGSVVVDRVTQQILPESQVRVEEAEKTPTARLQSPGAPLSATEVEVPEGFRIKSAETNAKGQVQYRFEPDTANTDTEREIESLKSGLAQATRAVEDIDKVVALVNKSKLPAVGRMSDFIAKVPFDTGANDVRKLIENIEADVAFKTLADMRRNSPTGGALGAISEKELALLAAAEGSISPSLSPRLFKENLQRIQKARKDFVELVTSNLKNLQSQQSQDRQRQIDALAERLEKMDRSDPAFAQTREQLKNLMRQSR
jgi:hypothetical protein